MKYKHLTLLPQVSRTVPSRTDPHRPDAAERSRVAEGLRRLSAALATANPSPRTVAKICESGPSTIAELERVAAKYRDLPPTVSVEALAAMGFDVPPEPAEIEDGGPDYSPS